MQTSAGWRLCRLLVGGSVLLLGVLAAPSAVRASCGDYVMIGGHPAAKADATTPRQTPHDTGHPGPCSGPFCSRGPTLPPLLPVAVVTVSAEHWGCLLCPPTLPEPDARSLPCAAPLPLPERLPCSIFHPPRA
jgi:hypothetical protein